MSLLETTRLVGKINEYVKNAAGDYETRYNTITSVVGAVIGTQLPLPATSVANHRIHYQQTVYPIAADYLDAINEAYPLDLDVAFECAYLLWYDRYKMVHAPRLDVSLLLSQVTRATEFSVSTALDENRRAAISRLINSEEAASLNGIFLELLKNIKQDEE